MRVAYYAIKDKETNELVDIISAEIYPEESAFEVMKIFQTDLSESISFIGEREGFIL